MNPSLTPFSGQAPCRRRCSHNLRAHIRVMNLLVGSAAITSFSSASRTARRERARVRLSWKVLGAIVQAHSVSTLPIGLTPRVSLWSAMNAIRTGVGSRTPPRRDLPHGGPLSHCAVRRPPSSRP